MLNTEEVKEDPIDGSYIFESAVFLCLENKWLEETEYSWFSRLLIDGMETTNAHLINTGRNTWQWATS